MPLCGYAVIYSVGHTFSTSLKFHLCLRSSVYLLEGACLWFLNFYHFSISQSLYQWHSDLITIVFFLKKDFICGSVCLKFPSPSLTSPSPSSLSLLSPSLSLLLFPVSPLFRLECLYSFHFLHLHECEFWQQLVVLLQESWDINWDRTDSTDQIVETDIFQ